MVLASVSALTAFVAGATFGNQTAYRSLGYGMEPAFSWLRPRWLIRAWFNR